MFYFGKTLKNHLQIELTSKELSSLADGVLIVTSITVIQCNVPIKWDEKHCTSSAVLQCLKALVDSVVQCHRTSRQSV